MSEIEQLVKMANQIAENFSFHDDVVDRVTDHLQRFWAPSMLKDLIEFRKEDGGRLHSAVVAAVERLEK
jgi:hypothetical protein